jgi:hypothetical protein
LRDENGGGHTIEKAPVDKAAAAAFALIVRSCLILETNETNSFVTFAQDD